MDGRYLEALLGGGAVRVYGYRLEVLRLCHVAGLEVMDAPVLRSRLVGPADALLAARVCAAGSLAEVAALVAGRTRRRDRWSVWWRSVWWARRAGEERKKLEGWLAREDAGPRLLPRGNGGERLGSPWTELLVVRMCAAGRGSEAEVWRMRVCRALWADVAWKEECSGRRASLLSDEEVRRLVELGWDPGEFGG